MNLGIFSVSLAVRDLEASYAFYQKLGFTILDGKIEDHWLMLQNGDIKIGLFQGMFEQNVLTFNGNNVRDIQAALRAQGIEPVQAADETTTGPAHFTVVDPDGNPLLFDQFA